MDNMAQGGGCSFYRGMRNVTTKKQIRSGAWDLEDLVKVGRRVRGCPYYASREMLPSADIIFCPYNYLIDPVIREQMGANVKNSIVILDEAHNIEDAAREAASFEFPDSELTAATSDLDAIETSIGHPLGLHVARFAEIFRSILDWLTQEATLEEGTVSDAFAKEILPATLRRVCVSFNILTFSYSRPVRRYAAGQMRAEPSGTMA